MAQSALFSVPGRVPGSILDSQCCTRRKHYCCYDQFYLRALIFPRESSSRILSSSCMVSYFTFDTWFRILVVQEIKFPPDDLRESSEIRPSRETGALLGRIFKLATSLQGMRICTRGFAQKDLHKEATIEECNIETAVRQWFRGWSGVMPAGLN